MSDYEKLKGLAEAANAVAGDVSVEMTLAGDPGPNQEEIDAVTAFMGMATPAAVLALIAENERLTGFVVRRRSQEDQYDAALVEVADQRDQLKAENAGLKTGYEAYEQVVQGLKAENELARMRIKELDLLFGRYILAMRAAVIEEEHGNGRARAMEWIYNSLAGPGELPPEDETDAQAYFDREIVAVDDGMQEVMAFHEGRRAAMGKGEQS